MSKINGKSFAPDITPEKENKIFSDLKDNIKMIIEIQKNSLDHLKQDLKKMTYIQMLGSYSLFSAAFCEAHITELNELLKIANKKSYFDLKNKQIRYEKYLQNQVGEISDEKTRVVLKVYQHCLNTIKDNC